MDKPEERIRWGAEQRLEFIEFRAFWEGGVNRREITEKFGVSVPQASNDLTLYQKIAPDNLRYDSSEKRYVPTDKFSPQYLEPSADRYLSQLQSVAAETIRMDDTWLPKPLDTGVLPVPFRRIEPQNLKRLVAAIRGGRSIEINYQSMNNTRPEAVWRRISPHAFGYDGLRWHIRAYCHIDGKFKDFILSRCRDLRNEGDAAVPSSRDESWHSTFDVKLIPNPDLTPSQQETIALDYGMEDGRAIIPVRRALLYYFEKRLRLDVDARKDRPAEKPVVLANQVEFIKARDAAMA